MQYISRDKKTVKLLQKKAFDKAINYLHTKIDKKIEVVFNSLILSEILMLQKDIIHSLEVLEKINLETIHVEKSVEYDICQKLADLYNQIGDYKKSYENLQKALKIIPNEEKILSRIGLLYIDVKKVDDADNIFNYLTGKRPENIYYKSLNALYFIEKNEFEKA